MQIEQYRQYLDMMNQWLILKQEGKSIEPYLRKKEYRSVAVYGMAIYGRHVIRELQGTAIKVLYGIDQKEMRPYRGVDVLHPMVALPEVDAIINTVLHQHMEIKRDLTKMVDCPIESLEDIVYESYE